MKSSSTGLEQTVSDVLGYIWESPLKVILGAGIVVALLVLQGFLNVRQSEINFNQGVIAAARGMAVATLKEDPSTGESRWVVEKK